MKDYTRLFFSVLLTSVAMLLFFGCDQHDRGRLPRADAVALLQPTKGNTVFGEVRFYKVEGGVRFVADITGLSPGAHGFHIHEFGDCRADDGQSAGDHFNPHSAPHGPPDSDDRHAGDLGNLAADENGAATFDGMSSLLALDGDHTILGRSVIVHADEDDFTTQPHGAAGARLACGVIGLARK